MSRKTIEKNLKNALIEDGILHQSLFEYELAEHVEEYIQSKHEDNDEFFFAITEHTNHVAMLLIDKNDNVHINEEARSLLKEIWQSAYKKNIQKLLPDMASELDAGCLYSVGIKFV